MKGVTYFAFVCALTTLKNIYKVSVYNASMHGKPKHK